MKLRLTVFFLGCLLISTANGQDDLNIFGFFQTYYSTSVSDQTVTAQIPGVGAFEQKSGTASNTANLQQMNIFFQKDLGNNFSAWANLELVNSYNSSNNWGNMSIEEAWVRYTFSSKLQIKVGQLIPKFNALNEVKNRMPYLPYIFRPFIYETAVKGIIPPDRFLPLSAFLQFYGAIPVTNSVDVDYAVFIGNPESSFIASADDGISLRGTDNTTHNQGGGRVGLNVNTLHVGVSVSSDNANLNEAGLGEPKRTRLGLDLAYSIFNFTAQGEYLQVSVDAEPPTETGFESYDKTFYYGTLQYDVNEKLYAYGMYSVVEDKGSSELSGNGLQTVSLGLGYRFTDMVQAKLQWANYYINDGKTILPIPTQTGDILQIPGDFEIDVQAIYAGVSVFF